MSRFLLGIVLNTGFIIVEIIYGFVANSVALIADAVHNASDVLGLVLVWASYYIADRRAPHKFTYGYKNATIFAAFLNCIILLFAIANLLWTSLHRLSDPEPVASTIVIFVAAIGVFINGITALLFMKDRQSDINIHALFLNMALDTILSISVVVGGVLIWWKGWNLIDPILGIIIAVTIIYSFWGVFKESINLIFQAVPSSIDLQELIAAIEGMDHIASYHDLHVWALSTTETALSVHVVTSSQDYNPLLIHDLAQMFRDKFNIQHTTIQMEVAVIAADCSCYC
jgi:cobalt-zinc-cadmium efflux system protein